MSNIKEASNIVDKVQARVNAMTNSGELHLPRNYSPQNALKSAWLILQDTVDRNKKPVLAACNKTSIANALLKMITMGLNPAKSQCYFIAYGNKLSCSPSYFGNMKLAKDAGVKEIYAQVIYKGDKLKTVIEHGNEKIVEHESTFESKVKAEVIGAYAVAVFEDDRPDKTTIETLDQIKKAWLQGKIYEEGKEGTTHEKFTEEMCKKTVINNLCKSIINSSDDSNLEIKNAFNEADEIRAEEEMEKEIEENANSEYIDVNVEEEVPNDMPAEEHIPADMDIPEEGEELKQSNIFDDPEVQDHIMDGEPPF